MDIPSKNGTPSLARIIGYAQVSTTEPGGVDALKVQVTGGQGAEPSWPASSSADQPVPATRPEEDEILRQDVAAAEAQRREIDRLAEEKMETMQAVLDQYICPQCGDELTEDK